MDVWQGHEYVTGYFLQLNFQKHMTSKEDINLSFPQFYYHMNDCQNLNQYDILITLWGILSYNSIPDGRWFWIK